MKIFNWVQKKFPRNVLKDGLARNVKKTNSVAIDTNSKALLEQVAVFDVLDGWRYGVLTIATFGFDPLKSISEQKDHLADEDDQEETERCSNNNDDDDDHNGDEEVNPLLFRHDPGKLRRRITLADLFHEENSDFDVEKKPPSPKPTPNPCKKASVRTKNEPCFARKFVHDQVGKDSLPVKKLNQMMKRMLKRKIHPGIERKAMEGQFKS